MTKEQLNKGNSITLDIKTASDRLDAFKDLYNSGKCENREDFYICYTHNNMHCIIQESGDIYDILKALIKYESDRIKKLEKEFEEL